MKQSLLAAIALASAIMLFWRGRPVPAVHAAASVRSHPAAYFVCLGHRAMLEGPDSREPGDDEPGRLDPVDSREQQVHQHQIDA